MVDDQSEEILQGKGPQTKKLMLLIIIITAVVMGVMGTGFYILWSKVAPPDPELTLEYETIKKEAKMQYIILTNLFLDCFSSSKNSNANAVTVKYGISVATAKVAK